jgi:hypothetical protein
MHLEAPLKILCGIEFLTFAVFMLIMTSTKWAAGFLGVCASLCLGWPTYAQCTREWLVSPNQSSGISDSFEKLGAPAISKSICSRAKNLTAHSCQQLPPQIEEQDEKDIMTWPASGRVDDCWCYLLIVIKMTEGATIVTIFHAEEVSVGSNMQKESL